jgi:hypothetical protein
LVIEELSNAAISFLLLLFSLLFFSRIVSYKNKSAFILEDGKSWCFYKNGKKHSFGIDEISQIRKSFLGLYSWFVITVDKTGLCIPAEMKGLKEFINALSQHLPKERIANLIKFHENSQLIYFEMEKSAKFLRIFCFFIPPIAFFVAKCVWQNVPLIICVLWTILSLVFPLIWTMLHWVLLSISVHNLIVFSKISAIWTFFGFLLYMIAGIAYHKFYIWIALFHRG